MTHSLKQLYWLLQASARSTPLAAATDTLRGHEFHYSLIFPAVMSACLQCKRSVMAWCSRAGKGAISGVIPWQATCVHFCSSL